MAKARRDSQTGDLFDRPLPQVAARFDDGAIRGNRLASQISQVVAAALRDHDRSDVAAKMTEELGYPVSHDMVDKYASQAAANKITLERFIALIEATNCVAALDFIAERFGHVVVPARYESLIKDHLAEERIEELRQIQIAERAKWKASR